MTTYFISDLHLDPKRPVTTKLFVQLCRDRFAHAEALYILGDFLEYWLGDDQPIDAGLAPAFSALRELSAQVPVYLMHGNRDFLIGDSFAKNHGCKLIADPLVIELYGKPTLLMHGDTLCTDDADYQQFRSMVRNSEWQENFLSKPIAERIAIAEGIRKDSKQANAAKSAEIMDVNLEQVENTFSAHQVSQIIHGHTHRPKMHRHIINGQEKKRIVMGDWYKTGSVLSVNAEGFKLEQID